MDENYEIQNEESTKGIDVNQWNFPLENGKNFKVNIWDFGGQEIYHSTHQFFLKKRSLYALVADTRKEDTDFFYWCNIVELLSDKSPLLIIKNEKKDRRRDINERQLRSQFENLKDTFSTKFATNRGLFDIIKNIKNYTNLLFHIGNPLPKKWVNVKNDLESKTKLNYISDKEYFDICERHGFISVDDKLQLSGYLHDLGVCLHFQQDPLLKKTVILNPEWGTEAVYRILDNDSVIENQGRFKRTDLRKIWDEDKYVNMHDELLQLMINFQLCYEIPFQKDSFITPQLLHETQPLYEWHDENNIILRYVFQFMHKGIITRFIVMMHPFISYDVEETIEGNLFPIENTWKVWKSGVVLNKSDKIEELEKTSEQIDNSTAEIIEHYDKREIKIRIAGKQKTLFLESLLTR